MKSNHKTSNKALLGTRHKVSGPQNADVGRRTEMKIRIFAMLLSFALISTAYAGQFWPVTCQNPECNFKGEMDSGGGWTFGQVSGFCTTCRKIVTISWAQQPDSTNNISFVKSDAETNATPPEIIGSIWNPATGIISDLYACPYCKKPFVEFEQFALSKAQLEGMVFCPMCTKLTLKVNMYGNYD